MKRIHSGTLLFAFLLGLVGLWGLSRPTRGAGGEAEGRARPSSEPSTGRRLEEIPVAARTSRTGREPTESGEDARRGQSRASDSCVVLGRVVDEQNTPLPGATVYLATLDAWSEEQGAKPVAAPLGRLGFETVTAASGAFRFEVPVPRPGMTLLAVEPSTYREAYLVSFPSARVADQPELRAGERDLGTIRLSSRGAIRGTVTDRGGVPIPDARVTTGPSPGRTFDLTEARSDRDGRFFLPHATIGTLGVEVSAEGYLDAFQTPVTVEAGRETRAVRVLLEEAPTLAGWVRDEAGRPLAGALVRGGGGRTRSEEDGSFRLFLAREGACALDVELAGHETFCEDFGAPARFEPGSAGIEIVLRSLPSIGFVVVDAADGEVLERFGLEIRENEGSRSMHPIFTSGRTAPRVREHPGGVARASGREGEDAVTVAAKGFLTQTVDVGPDALTAGLQTIALEAGSSLRGRVVDGEAPVVGARVVDEEVNQVRLARLGEPLPEASWQADPESRRWVETDAAGRFQLSTLEPGTHRLSIQPRTGAPFAMEPLALGRGEALDLGEIPLQAGASIEGRVLVPPGIDPANLAVIVDGWDGGISTRVNSAGEFWLGELSSGRHTVLLDGRPGQLAPTEGTDVDLVAGEVESLVLDARDREVCEVDLRVRLGGAFIPGLQVDLVSVENRFESGSLGKTDREGRVAGFVRAFGEASVRLWSEPYGVLEFPKTRLQLLPGARLEESLEFALAALRIELPSGAELPVDGAAVLEFEALEGERSAQRVSVEFSAGVGPSTGPARGLAGVLELDALLPGRVHMTLRLLDRGAEIEEVPAPGGGRMRRRHARYTVERTFTLVAGSTLDLSLRH